VSQAQRPLRSGERDAAQRVFKKRTAKWREQQKQIDALTSQLRRGSGANQKVRAQFGLNKSAGEVVTNTLSEIQTKEKELTP
jgi:hypothetical protein